MKSEEFANHSGLGDQELNGDSSGNLGALEDYNQGVWHNPSLSATYEPFNPFATATPSIYPTQSSLPSPTIDVQAQLTAIPTNTLSPTDSLPVVPMPTLVPEQKTNSSNIFMIIVVIVLLLIAIIASIAYVNYRLKI